MVSQFPPKNPDGSMAPDLALLDQEMQNALQDSLDACKAIPDASIRLQTRALLSSHMADRFHRLIMHIVSNMSKPKPGEAFLHGPVTYEYTCANCGSAVLNIPPAAHDEKKQPICIMCVETGEWQG